MMRNWVMLLILLFSTTAVANADNSTCKEHTCIAVIDAGSTGSRLHVYAYDIANATPQNIKEIFSKKINPGISSVDTNQEAINQYLVKLFSLTNITDVNIPVYFYATAGMRLLPQQKQQAIYDHIKKWFDSQPQWQLVKAKTITGKDEGVFGWLAVNYVLGTLTSESTQAPVGVMDTGGASVQVTFPITDHQSINNNDQVELDINGQHLHLFVHSFLGLGQNELDHQFLDVPECFSKNYILTNSTLGQGSLYSCEQQTSALINSVHHVDKIVKSALDVNPVATWYGIGGIEYLVQTPPLLFLDSQFTMKQLADKANNEFCQKDWNELYANYPSNDYLFTSCLNSSYFYALFVDGYGINQNQPIHYFPSSQNSGDWTLGVVLHH